MCSSRELSLEWASCCSAGGRKLQLSDRGKIVTPRAYLVTWKWFLEIFSENIEVNEYRWLLNVNPSIWWIHFLSLLYSQAAHFKLQRIFNFYLVYRILIFSEIIWKFKQNGIYEKWVIFLWVIFVFHVSWLLKRFMTFGHLSWFLLIFHILLFVLKFGSIIKALNQDIILSSIILYRLWRIMQD